MAEILLSLTIIGVVAAITLPSLTGNINERTWNTQRKALFARMSQAIALMPSLNGYGTLIEETEEQPAVDTVAETFITEGLSKVLKINNICDNEHLLDCGISKNYTNLAGNQKTFPTTLSEMNSLFNSVAKISFDTKAAAFETQNGESIVVLYNPKCIGNLNEQMSWHYSQPKMCANFIYDLNGKKGPNTVGKDIGFITALYPTDPSVVAPQPLKDVGRNQQFNTASAFCQKQSTPGRLPNIEELTAMFYNRELLDYEDNYYWSGSVFSSAYTWLIDWATGKRQPHSVALYDKVPCVKR